MREDVGVDLQSSERSVESMDRDYESMNSRTRSSSSLRRINEDTNAGEVSFGAWLRRHRELREVTLAEIAAVTKISTRYLEALEEDRFDVLPAPVFARGFLREYAKYVGLDPDEVVNSYITAQQEEDPDEVEGGAGGLQRRRLKGPPLLLIIIAVLLLVGLVTVLLLYGRRRPDAPEQLSPPVQQEILSAPPQTKTLAEEPPPLEVTAPLNVTLGFTENCWVEATVDGRRQISELRVHGDSMQLEAQKRVLLTLGNPRGVHIEVNGIAYQPELATGRVARNLDIDLDLLRVLEGSR